MVRKKYLRRRTAALSARFELIIMIALGFALLFALLSPRTSWADQALVQEKGCVACHGTNGIASAPAYPNLKGQWRAYLYRQLKAYKSGRRQNAIMNGFASQLTEEEIRTLAAYYASQ